MSCYVCCRPKAVTIVAIQIGCIICHQRKTIGLCGPCMEIYRNGDVIEPPPIEQEWLDCDCGRRPRGAA